MQHQPVLKAGQRLGNFVVDQTIGSSSRGRVYGASHAALRYPVVIKLLFEETESEKKRELSILSGLAGDPAPELLDVGVHVSEQGLCPYYVMDLVEGETVSRALRTHRRFDAKRVRELGIQLLQAIGRVHELGYCHCDIKPENVMLSFGQCGMERVSLLDFGAAQSLDTGPDKTGQLRGTPPYVAPEIMRGADPSILSDIYSVAAVLYECASGRRCPESTSGQAIQPLHRVVPIAQGLSDLIARALHPNPAARFSSTEEFRDALLELEIEDVVEVGLDGTLSGTSQETLDTVRLDRDNSPAAPKRLRSVPWYGDGALLLSTERPVVWALSGDPGIDQASVLSALESLRDEFDIVLLDDEARDRKRVDFMYGARPPSVLLFGDLHVLLSDPLLAEVGRQGETSCFLVSTHENLELLHSTVNACSLHGQICLPQRPEVIAHQVVRMVERAASVRRHYDGLRLALRDAQDDLETLRRTLGLIHS